MAWIGLIEPSEAGGKLKELYDMAAQGSGGIVGPMIRAGSLDPDVLEGRMKTYRALMYGRATSLTRADREMIAVVTSVANACEF